MSFILCSGNEVAIDASTGEVSSGNDEIPIHILVENLFEDPVDIFFDDGNKRGTFMFTLEEDGGKSIDSFHGHRFYATEPGKNKRIDKFTVKRNRLIYKVGMSAEMKEMVDVAFNNKSPSKSKKAADIFKNQGKVPFNENKGKTGKNGKEKIVDPSKLITFMGEPTFNANPASKKVLTVELRSRAHPLVKPMSAKDTAGTPSDSMMSAKFRSLSPRVVDLW